jgi:hypothetical protein
VQPEPKVRLPSINQRHRKLILHQGGSVIDHLLSSSKPYRIRAVTRDPSKPSGKKLEDKGCEVVKAEMGNADEVKKAVEGSEIVFVRHCPTDPSDLLLTPLRPTGRHQLLASYSYSSYPLVRLTLCVEQGTWRRKGDRGRQDPH